MLASRCVLRPVIRLGPLNQRLSPTLRAHPSRFFHQTPPRARNLPRYDRGAFQERGQPKGQYQYQYQNSNFQRPGNIFQRWAARPTFYYQVAGLGAAGGGFYILNLEEVPVSGRRRFNVVSPATETEMSKQMYEQVLKEYGSKILPAWDRRTKMVQRVLDRLIPASGLTDAQWEIHVIDQPDEKNAFVIPGGKVFVFTGILPICANDDGLAAVLGHEIAHNVAHHAAERMSQGVLVVGALWIARLVAILTTGQIYGELDYATQWLLDLAFTKPGSRKQESEADYIGLLMAAQSCYDPREAVQVWARMAKSGQHAPPQFLSTHPSDETRMKTIESWLPEALSKAANSDCASTLEEANKFRKTFKQNVF